MTEFKKILLFSLGFILLYNLFFFQVSLGLGLVVIILFLNIFFFFIRENSKKNLPFAILNSFLGILFSFLFAYRGNEVVRFFDLLLSLFFSLNALFLYKAQELFRVNTLDFLLLPLQVVLGSFKGVGEINKGSLQEDKNTFLNPSLIRGFIIAVPVFLILLLLLINADPIFGKFAGDLFSTLGNRTLFSILIFITLLALGFTKAIGQREGSVDTTIVSGKVHELSLILGSMVVLFASFIFIQLRYLFSGVGERELAQVGIKSLTYSQYVNQGFFELLIVAAISSLVMAYAIHSIHKLHSSEKLLTQSLGGVLVFETWIILLSDFKRLSLYASAHGLTRARIFGFIFLVWLTLYLLVLGWRMLQRLNREVVFSALLVITIPLLLLINIFNIDSVIATRFVPTVNKEVDYYYITGLSTDASSSWGDIILAMNTQISELEKVQNLSGDDSRKIYWINTTLNQLNSSKTYLSDNYKPAHFKWQSLNFSEYIAYQTVLENQNLFGQLDNLLERGKVLDSRIGPEARSNTWLDRSINPPLQ